jgi:menaquinone-dependent protoporphyrinogen oxidase
VGDGRGGTLCGPRDPTTEEETSMSNPLRVLVTAASKHGSTAEIAMAIAQGLERGDAGVTAVSIQVDQRPEPARFDAVVLGSAVYAGRWLEAARDYAAAHAGSLRERPVWLFSSGPIGEPPSPPDEPHDAAPLVQLLGAREHAVFPGRLDKARLTFGERAMVTAMRAPLGDFRDWEAVQRWTARIAAELLAGTSTGGQVGG